MPRYDEDTPVIAPHGKLGYAVKTQTAHIFTVNITTEILEPDHYTEIFQLLLDASPADTIQFNINSPGGSLYGLDMILGGLTLTEAHTTAILIGEVASAASVLAMAVDDVLVLPTAEMLCHTSRYGVGGKSPDVESQVAHHQKMTKQVMKTYYEGFLTPEEIEGMLRGHEIYLDAAQIEDRLAQRAEYFLALEEKEIEDAKLAEVAANPPVQPEKRGGKSTKKQQAPDS